MTQSPITSYFVCAQLETQHKDSYPKHIYSLTYNLWFSFSAYWGNDGPLKTQHAIDLLLLCAAENGELTE